jgi:hypothetical protein
MTRRLVFGMLTGLAQQVQKTQGDARLAQHGLQDDLLSMKHACAVAQVRGAQVGIPPPPKPSRLPMHLPTRVDMTRDADGGMSLHFFSDDREIGQLAFGERELHWFLERLVAHARQAGWGEPIPLPLWLSQAADEAAGNRSNEVTPPAIH